MNRIINFRSFNVFTLEKEQWDYGYHNHNFYELIFIEKGKGKHRLNGVSFNYQKGAVFLLTPADKHAFTIEQKTKFIYLKYTEQFLLDLLTIRTNHNWKESVKLTLSGKRHIYETLIHCKEEQAQVFQLARLLLNEFTHSRFYKEEVIADLFSALLTILIRNINKTNGRKSWLSVEGEKIDQVLSYISTNALDKEKMKLSAMATEFLMSVNYISIYVKKHTGLSIQQHVLKYKMKAAEKLLKQSRYNINEISEKLGFNDASHFNKIFKKQFGCSPAKLRLNGTAN